MVWSVIFLSLFMVLPVKRTDIIFMSIVCSIILMKLQFREVQAELLLFFVDNMSLSMMHLSLILMCLSVVVFHKSKDRTKIFLCSASAMMAFLFFQVSNFTALFILFEASLIPLMILIIGWGKQPERLMAGQYIMFYTLISSFSLLCLVVFMEEINGIYSMQNQMICSNYSMSMWTSELTFFISVSFILAFLMKVPMFFLHSWLPKAHVEAPLEGSIILAGIMLKVGTFGIMRVIYLFPSDSYNFIIFIVACVSIVGSVISVTMAVSSDDLKLSIAMSSISHMNFLLCSMMSLKELTIPMTIMVMISHGFSSSILFFFVSIIYEMNHSRSLSLVKGSMSKVPSLLLMSFIFFSLSISIPPSLPFMGEMMSISSIWYMSKEMIPMMCLFIMFNSFYSMMNYGIMNQSPFFKTSKPSESIIIFNLKSSFSLMIMIFIFFFPELLV